jgi:hypothetical protein
MRYESYNTSPPNETPPVPRAPAVDRAPSTADLASDLEAELMRELQASFNAVRAPMESPRQPDLSASNYDEVDFDAFAEVHYRRNAPMEAAPPPQPKSGIESLATWREQTRPRQKQSGPSFRQRLAEGAAESSAPLRTSSEIRYDPADPIAADPEFAAVAAAAESFSNVSPERAEAAPLAYGRAADESGYDYVPGYGPPADAAYEDEEHELRPPSRRRPLILVGGLLGVVLVGAIGFFAITTFTGGESGPPPLIVADSGPIKLRPESPGGAASSEQSKLIYDRVGGDTANAELAPDRTVTTVSRPETQQTDASREISRIILPDPTDPPAEDEPAVSSTESDSVGPKRVRTVVVRPDGTIVSSTSAPASPPAAAPVAAPVSSAPAVASAAPAPRSADAPAARESVTPVAPDEPASSEEPEDLGLADDWETADAPAAADAAPVGATKPTPPPAKPAPVATARAATDAAPAENTGPLSLLPKSGGARSEPDRVASVEPAPQKPAAAAPAPVATGAYFVQVSSQRSEAAALAAYREVQRRFSGVLGDREPDIQRADLGSRGVYYRARVSPGLSNSAAISLCTSLKNAGGDCIVTQN